MVFYINSTPYVLLLSNLLTQTLNLQEVRLYVDTTTDAISILLPKVADFPAQNVKIYVTDYKGNAAANNITVEADPADTINGAASVVISANKGSLKLEIGADNEWINTGSSGGGSGSATVAIPITAEDFVGTLYQDNRLIGKTPLSGFNVYVNVGTGVAASGTIVNPVDFYAFDSGTGTLDMPADNYLIEIY